MKKYYNRNKFKKKSNVNRKVGNVVRSIIALFALFGIVSGLLALVDFSWFDNLIKKDKTDYVDVHFVPGEAWASDDSSYGAWLWNDDGVPAGAFVLSSNEDGDGVYSVRVSSEYTNILFVDLVPGATELGSSWANKREQTNNLLVPTDANNIYHVYASEWSNTSDVLFTVTTEELQVYIEADAWDINTYPYAYYFDKTGVSEPNFVEMIQCGAHQYFANIPAGYTHVIFINYGSETNVGTWENIINQTSDLIIPTDEFNHYNTLSNEWDAPVIE